MSFVRLLIKYIGLELGYFSLWIELYADNVGLVQSLISNCKLHLLLESSLLYVDEHLTTGWKS